jgi:hypothetical protein
MAPRQARRPTTAAADLLGVAGRLPARPIRTVVAFLDAVLAASHCSTLRLRCRLCDCGRLGPSALGAPTSRDDELGPRVGTRRLGTANALAHRLVAVSWPVAAGGGGRPSSACRVGMESGRKPYPALFRSGDDGAPGVMPLLEGVVEDSAIATYSTELHLWVKAPCFGLWQWRPLSLLKASLPVAIDVPDATLSSPYPLHPLLSFSFLGVCLPAPCSPLG